MTFWGKLGEYPVTSNHLLKTKTCSTFFFDLEKKTFKMLYNDVNVIRYLWL